MPPLFLRRKSQVSFFRHSANRPGKQPTYIRTRLANDHLLHICSHFTGETSTKIKIFHTFFTVQLHLRFCVQPKRFICPLFAAPPAPRLSTALLVTKKMSLVVVSRA